MLACGPAPDPPPNLLLLTAEDLPPGALACYREESSGRSGVCALAEQGTRYRLAFAEADSVAGETASLMTSRKPDLHGVDASAASFLRQSARTLAEALRDGGYATAAIVASPRLNRSRKLDQGFDHYDERFASPALAASERLRALEAAIDVAIAWMARDPRPWFLWIHLPGPVASPDGAARGQAAHVAALDAAVERLLERLPEETAVLFVGTREAAALDPAGDPGALRIPLFWTPAGGSPPRAVDTPVSTLDLAPTLVRAARLSAPESFTGSPLPLADFSAAEGQPGMPREMLRRAPAGNDER